MGSKFDPLTQDHPIAYVVKVEPYPFNNGGSADLWKGKAPGSAQVLAVKVPRGAVAGADITKLKKRLIQEGFVWSKVTHPNITPFLGISFDFDRPGLPCLVSPYYRHGSITSYLKNRPHVNKLPLITQIADAMSYLHDASIIHGDIKGSNVLVNDEGKASLTDFGLSFILQESGFTTKTVSGTWRFMAPELMSAEEVRMRMTQATDVWAFSMTVVEILTDRLPFSHIGHVPGVIIAIMEGGHPKRKDCRQIQDSIWRMLEKCWGVDPKQRPSAMTLSRFFASISTSNTQTGLTAVV